MRHATKYRPSPAMVVALIALFVSLGGVSYGLAKGSIDSRELKNNNVRSVDLRNNDARGRDIRNGTITGADVQESSLGTVPTANTANSANSANTANSANSATTATDANSVGGFSVRRIDFRADTGTGPTEILNFLGLRITASCPSENNNPGTNDVDVSTPPGSNLSAWGYNGTDATSPLDSAALDIENFTGGDLNDINDQLGGSGNSHGVQLLYHRSNGQVVTAHFNMDEEGGDLVPFDCIIGGTAIGG